jgi:spermidine synthase
MAVRRDPRPYFFLFFLSGFCGLLYQIVWMRKAFASFGIISPVVSVVVSVFMLGLYVGAVAAGRGVDRISRRLGVRPIQLYAATEILIGIGSVAVPWLFRIGEAVLLPISNSSSATYLALSGLTIALSIFPWCVCMGATYPFVMAHLKGDAAHRRRPHRTPRLSAHAPCRNGGELRGGRAGALAGRARDLRG